jgi:hypothetical protein
VGDQVEISRELEGERSGGWDVDDHSDTIIKMGFVHSDPPDLRKMYTRVIVS